MIHVIMFLLLAYSPAANAGFSEADVLYQEGEAANAKQNYEQASLKFEQALKIYQRENNRQKIGDSAYQLGMARRRNGEIPIAMDVLKLAMKSHEAIGDKQAIGWDLTELGIVYRKQGNLALSLESSRKALAIHEELGNQQGIVKALQTLGQAHHFKGEYEEATKYFDRALPIAEEINDKKMIAGIHSDFGSVYWIQGDFTRALEKYDKGLKIAEELSDLRLQGSIVGNRGLVYWNQGDLTRALEDSMTCAKLFEQAGVHDLGTSYYNIGTLQGNLGDYGQAQESLQKSLEMAVQANDQGLKGVALESLGMLQKELGNYDSALKYLQESLLVTQQTGEKRATAYALIGLGTIHEEQKNYSDALEFYRKGYRLYTEMGEKKGIANSLSNIGEVYAKLGNQDRALANFKAALTIRESIGNRPGIGSSYMRIGSAYLKKKELSEAEASLTKSIDVLRKVGQPDLLWPALYKKGQLYLDLGNTAESLQLMKEAVDLIEKVRGEVRLPEQKWAFLENKLDVYEDLIGLLVSNQNIPEAFQYVQRSKARAFLDLLSEAHIDPQANLNLEQHEEKKKLLAQLTNVNQEIREEYEKDELNPTKVQQLEKRRNELDQGYVNLLLEIRTENPRYAGLQYTQPLQLIQAQTLTDDQTVLIDYFIGKRNSLIFVITSTASQVFTLPDQQKLNTQVREYLETLQNPEPIWETSNRSYSRYVKLAGVLYNELLKPAEALLKGKRRIVIAPDGALNYVPFESLLTANTGTPKIDFSKLSYLALDYDIQYIPSISVLAVMTQNVLGVGGVHRKELIAFADPLAASPTTTGRHPLAASDKTFRDWSTSLPELPYARAEVEEISKLYPKDAVKVLVGKEASEANVKELKLDEYRIVHFASHGLIDEDHPQFSALVLNGSEAAGGEDGFLTMREVFELKLNADLVVLSACKSGLGQQIRGEGVAGLSRAFFCAGTSSVLVSLWNVYDRSTAHFMTAFYKGLQQDGYNKAAAVREARLKMIRSKNYSHPYYWAPFILVGNP